MSRSSATRGGGFLGGSLPLPGLANGSPCFASDFAGASLSFLGAGLVFSRRSSRRATLVAIPSRPAQYIEGLLWVVSPPPVPEYGQLPVRALWVVANRFSMASKVFSSASVRPCL